MTARKLNILFTTWDGGGVTPPTIEAALRLIARGHDVRILGDETLRAPIERAGIAFKPWTEAPQRRDTSLENDPIQDWLYEGPMGGVMRMRDVIMSGGALAFARDTAAELDREVYDLVISSEMVLGAMIAAEARGVPLVVFAANLPMMPIPGIPPFGPGFWPATSDAERILHAEVAEGTRAMFNAGLPDLNAARAAFGLAPLDDLMAQMRAAERFLAASSKAFDFPAAEHPPGLVYVGAMAGSPVAAEGWKMPFSGMDMRPLVVVSFSTTYMKQHAQIAAVITALGRLPVRGIVTLGAALQDAGFETPPNVRVLAEAPHDVLMAEAGLVITHAGHGTVIRALTHGVPLICMPMGRDQNDNAARIDWHGAGLRIDPAADAVTIETAIRKVFGDASYRKAARRLKAAITADILNSPFVAEIEKVCETAGPRVPLASAAE
jgi:MGT family glycosyltransferase